jgi:hypothetical protein
MSGTDTPSPPRSDAARDMSRLPSRVTDLLRWAWYGFVRLFGLDSCPIDQGPGTTSVPGGHARTRDVGLDQKKRSHR